jgi:putative endonuclease
MKMSEIKELDVWHFGEESACNFLRKNGYKIVDRNYRTPQGEIDIVAGRKGIFLFVEVRTRSSSQFAEPWESVGHRKQKKLRQAAKMYVQEKAIFNAEFRFDVISITLSDAVKPQIEWIQNAF